MGRLPDDDDSKDDWDGCDWADRTGVRLGDLLDEARGENHENHYPEDWIERSKQLREEMDWRCQDCGIDLTSSKHLLHVHHVDHNKSNSQRLNLLVVCAYCHSRYSDHGHVLESVTTKDRELLVAHQKRLGRA